MPQKEGFAFTYLAMELDFLEGVDKILCLVDNLFSDMSKENETTSK